jgi:hypothetical protein
LILGDALYGLDNPDADARGDAGVASEFLETVERGHGRLETRRYRTLGDCSDDTKLGLQNKRLKAACNEDYLTTQMFTDEKKHYCVRV